MVLMGDEYGHTKEGNNNPWCQDSKLNWFLWNISSPLTSFYKKLIEIRKMRHILKDHTFLDPKDITWHGHMPHSPNWGKESRFIAYTLKNSLYIAFNASHKQADITLPAPHNTSIWIKLVDTKEQDITNTPLTENSYTMQPHTALILESSLL